MERIYSSRLQERKRGKRNILIFCIFILIIFMGGFYLWSKTKSNKNTVVSPLGKQLPLLTLTPPVTNSAGLTQIINTVLSGEDGDYGIYIKNLATGETYARNGEKSFDSASLYKLWVMAVVFNNIQNGSLKEDEMLSKNTQDLYNEFQVTPDPNEQEEPVTSFSVTDALKNMITISDNDSALLLTDKIGVTSIVSFLKKNNFTHSTVGNGGTPPATTPGDIGKFFERLYKGEFASQQYTQEMLTLLKNQSLNEKLPQNLPADVVVAHKTGELDSFSHDAGIVFTDKGNYVIVIMTNTTDTVHANALIAQISQQVYDYFSSK